MKSQGLHVLVGLLFACGSSSNSPTDAAVADTSVADGSTPDAGIDGGARSYVTEVLSTTTLTNTDTGRSWTGERARVRRPDGRSTYVHSFRSDREGPRPVVVLTMPYAGVTWTDEEVDARWAEYPLTDLRHPDVDQPDFDGNGLTYYEAHGVDEAHANAMLHLLNDFAVVLVYGRFYAGGSTLDDVEDMRAGMWFVAEEAAFDHARVGVYGGSWGGFEALFASAVADPRAPASVVVAAYPISDFASQAAHFSSRVADRPDWFLPYVRRIERGAPGGDFGGQRTADLCGSLPTATLVLHDEADNLVPFAQTEALVATCGVDHAYWLRSSEVPSLWSHGPMSEEPFPPSHITYGLAYLTARLATPDQTTLVGIVARASMLEHLESVREAQRAGRDVSFAARRLLELCDPRSFMFEAGTARPGAELVADLVNTVWGVSETAATVRDTLRTGLPPP